MTDFYNEDDKPIIMDLIYNSIIARSYLVERVVSLHFGGSRVRQVFGKVIYPFLNAAQVLFGKPLQAFQNGRSELDRIFHELKPQLLPESFGRNVFPGLAKGFFGIFNVNAIFNILQ